MVVPSARLSSKPESSHQFKARRRRNALGRARRLCAASVSGVLNEFGEPAAGYTNYELWLIKNTPDFSKSSFYANGMPAPAPF